MTHTEYRWVGTCVVCGGEVRQQLVSSPPIGYVGPVAHRGCLVLGRSAARLAGFNGALIPRLGMPGRRGSLGCGSHSIGIGAVECQPGGKEAINPSMAPICRAYELWSSPNSTPFCPPCQTVRPTRPPNKIGHAVALDNHAVKV